MGHHSAYVADKGRVIKIPLRLSEARDNSVGMSNPIIYLAVVPAAALFFQDWHSLERTWRLEVFGEHRQTSQLTVDKERSLSAAHRRMKAMFKKFHFTLRTGLVLVDASLASN